MATPRNLHGDVSAASLFNVEGLVAVVTGGGTGTITQNSDIQCPY